MFFVKYYLSRRVGGDGLLRRSERVVGPFTQRESAEKALIALCGLAEFDGGQIIERPESERG